MWISSASSVHPAIKSIRFQQHALSVLSKHGVTFMCLPPLFPWHPGVRGAIKEFSAWPSTVLNKIKILFASYSSKIRTRHSQCDVWAVNILCMHFSVWTQYLSDGVENANIRTAHKFLKNFSNNTDVAQQKCISQLIIRVETWIHHLDFESEQSMQWNEQIGQNCRFITLHNSCFSTSYANNRRPLKCTKYL